MTHLASAPRLPADMNVAPMLVGMGLVLVLLLGVSVAAAWLVIVLARGVRKRRENQPPR